MNFLTPGELSELPTLTPAQRDALEFGLVGVDDTGIILSYNRYESELGRVTPEEAIGKNFFTQIAPCTNNRLMYGRFKEGVAAGNLNAVVPYTFTYKIRPTNVVIHLYRDGASRTNWVLVKRR